MGKYYKPDVKILKLCKRCGEEKDFSQFADSNQTRDGKQFSCRDCMREYSRERYAVKRDILIEQARDWQSEHVDKRKEYQKKYQAKRRAERKAARAAAVEQIKEVIAPSTINPTVESLTVSNSNAEDCI